MCLTGILWYTLKHISYITLLSEVGNIHAQTTHSANFFTQSPEKWQSTGKSANDKQCENPELTSWASCALNCHWHMSLSMYKLVTGRGKPSTWIKTCPMSLCNIHLLWNVLGLNPEFKYISRYLFRSKNYNLNSYTGL